MKEQCAEKTTLTYFICTKIKGGSKNPLCSVLRPRRTTKSNRIEHSARTQSGAGVVFGTTLNNLLVISYVNEKTFIIFK